MTIIYEVDDPIATIALSRPERLNAMGYELLDEVRAAVDHAASDPRVVG